MTAIADRRANGIRTRNRPQVPGAPFISDLERAAAGGVATLDETTVLVPANQLAIGAPAAAKALMGDRTWGDIATQVELDAEAATRAAADTAETTARIADVDAEEAARIAADALKLAKASNLSDVANVVTSRTNLGLGDSAIKNVGAIAGTVCAGDDARLSDTRTPTDNTVSTIKLQADAVTYPKIQNVSATDKLLGRSTAGAGDIEEIACTAAARSILDDATVAAIATTLGLGTGDTPSFTALLLAAFTNARFQGGTNGQFDIANNATVNWPTTTEAGFGFIYDTNAGHAALVVWYGGSAAALVWQDGAAFSAASGTVGKINFYFSASTVHIENKSGATISMCGFLWKVK